MTGTDGSSYTLQANWRNPDGQPDRDHHLHGNRDRSRRQSHGDRDRYGNTGSAGGADRQHRRQPHFDCVRQFSTLTVARPTPPR